MEPTSNDRLPPLYLIADVDTAADAGVDLVDVVSQYLAAGGRMVSLRPGSANDRTLVDIGKRIAGLVFAVSGVFLVHRRVDLVQLLGADGVHLPARGFTGAEVYQIVRSRLLVGRSCHDEREVRRASASSGFVTLGPLFESVSKPGYGPGIDASTFRKLSNSTNARIYALGGVRPDNVEDCIDAGADGVAVLGGIVLADSPGEATAGYLEALQDAG